MVTQRPASTLTPLEIVRKQLLNLYSIEESISTVKDTKPYKIGDFEIGERTGKFTHKTYAELYKNMILDKQYHLSLNDESIISFYYLFDDENNIVKHSLSFIPSLDIDIILRNDYPESNNNLYSSKDQIAILKNTNNYVRIDFDLTGKTSIVHTDVHMHFGIFHTDSEIELNELRIPLEGVLYPYEFIYIILKYFYHADDQELTCLLVDQYLKPKKLETTELDKLILTFNRNSYSD